MAPVKNTDETCLSGREGEIRLAAVLVAALDVSVAGQPEGKAHVVTTDDRSRRCVDNVDAKLNVFLEEKTGQSHPERWLALREDADVDSFGRRRRLCRRVDSGLNLDKRHGFLERAADQPTDIGSAEREVCASDYSRMPDVVTMRRQDNGPRNSVRIATAYDRM